MVQSAIYNSGKYVITGSSIRFSLTSPEGTVDYDGVFQGSSLKLNTYSHINDHRGSETYEKVYQNPNPFK